MLTKSYAIIRSVIIFDPRDFELFNELDIQRHMNKSITVRGIQ